MYFENTVAQGGGGSNPPPFADVCFSGILKIQWLEVESMWIKVEANHLYKTTKTYFQIYFKFTLNRDVSAVDKIPNETVLFEIDVTELNIC